MKISKRPVAWCPPIAVLDPGITDEVETNLFHEKNGKKESQPFLPLADFILLGK
jgi:hypothetical protein